MLIALSHLCLALSAAARPLAADSTPHPVLLTLQVDSVTRISYPAWSAELRLPAPAGASAAATEIRLLGPVTHVGAFSALAHRGSADIPGAVLVLGASDGGAPVTATLSDVTIATLLVRSATADEAEDAVAALSVSVDEIAMQRDEAARRLAEVEALDRRRLAPANDVAAARARLANQERRLQLARQRLARVEERRRERGGPALELVLRARQVTLSTPAAGR